jgi:SAM-dependent methyltransferase
MISDLIKNRLVKEQFEPGFLGLFVNPFYIARRGLLEYVKILGKEVTGKTLDVGCGTKPYEKYFSSSEYIGLEVDTGIDREKKKADYFYEGKHIPFGDEEFDSVVTNQVLEHVFTPDDFLLEINRVLKPGGKLYLTVPFLWDEHEQPFDYARYSSFGITTLLEKNGFSIISLKKSVNDFNVISQMVNAYLYKITRNIRYIKQLVTIFIMAPITISGIILSKILPVNNDLYLDNIVLAQKKNP